MSLELLQSAVAEKIRVLYQTAQELESLFPGRHYTPDGHMIGSIGEALAACCFDLKLFEAGKETLTHRLQTVVWYKSKLRR